ncbi:MAG: reverse transcriptase family protein [Fuerstiella sp.]|nr:reverse transcriptase family protein [Fuerstiella sp.]
MTAREEIYDRIRNSSKDEFILEEMIRLGFWSRDSKKQVDSAEKIRREDELKRQLGALTSENVYSGNADVLKKQIRKQRLDDSSGSRYATKERRFQQKNQPAGVWGERKKSEVLYLGDGVSTSLSQLEGDAAVLSENGLPLLNTVADLARQMDLSVGELRWLSFHRRVATDTHYQRFGVPKKTGGIRTISVPRPRLKRVQQWILRNIIENVDLHQSAHGFRRGRSIVTNASPHVNSDVVINVDIMDFFPTVTFPRIRGVFRHLGYSGHLATVLALLCSEPDRTEVELDKRSYFVARTERRLPQGAPTSPGITNIICRGLDTRLNSIAERLGFRYTRYADDITFSGSGEAITMAGRVLRQIRHVVENEGFVLHPNKTRVLRKSRRQEVTGLVVNDRISVRRDLLRSFRATLFHIERDGPVGKYWGLSGNVMLSIEGFANFVAMVDADKGARFQERVRTLQERYGRGELKGVVRERWQPREKPDGSGATDQYGNSGTENSKQNEHSIGNVVRQRRWWQFWKYWSFLSEAAED